MNDCSICKNYEPVTAKMVGQKTAKGNPDVVQVVRCKDCEFNDDGYRCPFREAGWGYDPDRYCSFGERKEGE